MTLIKILLVEDNPGDALLTEEALEQGKIRNELRIVNDGEKALDLLHKRGEYSEVDTPDIILLDLNLPKVDGREVLKDVKANTHLKTIPIIILSSSEAAGDIQESYKLHANCFVTKPVKVDDFMAVVKTIESFWIDIVKLPR